ncbi:MAG: NnrS family protein [Rhizobiaceae bacterium]|nr:NnrS family protein [Rhizobiaceae bacterium]
METHPGRPAPATIDRSVLRNLRKTGNIERDGRGRIAAMPPILHYGFRPFFFLAALHAGLAIPLWLWAYAGGIEIGGPFGGMHWHAHEMLFGYLAAVVAGFVLTAVPNWTGRLPLSGWPLAVLVGLWLAGRAACLLLPVPWAAMVLDLAFPTTLAFAIWREVVAGRNWRNAPVAAMITLFGIANAADHLANGGWLPHDLGQRLALATVAMLIALIGGRIVPSFTRNWLVRTGAAGLPASFDRLDRAALAMTAGAMLAWLTVPETPVAGFALLAAGVLLALRLGRWRGLATVSEPIVVVLHAGYGWLCVALLLLGLSTLLPGIPASGAIHALTAGAVGTMTLAVMTRASFGHTGHAIVADRAVVAVYVLVTLGASLRVAAPFAGEWYLATLAAGGALWSGAFLLFAVRYAPILWGRRADA